MARRYVNDISSPYNHNWSRGTPDSEAKNKMNGAVRTPGTPWIPDPSLSHLLYAMRKVGPKTRMNDSGREHLPYV